MLSRTEPSLDKVRRCAALAMHESVTGNDHLAYAYAAWIKRYCEELLYEDMYRARPEDDQPADGEGG